MVAVITGDIINSKAVKPEEWMVKLKEILNSMGKEPADWEIYRGDSFQIKVKAEDGLFASLLIKATIKHWKQLDVRMAIGIGTEDYTSDRVSSCNGTAYVYSGESFDELKKETWVIKTPNEELNENLNLMLTLISPTINAWKPKTAELILNKALKPNITQADLAELMDKKAQATISEGLKRGGYEELERLMNYYIAKITA